MSKCKTCGGSINWLQRGGKWHALNDDGGSHWATCGGRTAKHEVSEGVRITPKDFLPSCGKCEVPPWDLCACSRFVEDGWLAIRCRETFQGFALLAGM